LRLIIAANVYNSLTEKSKGNPLPSFLDKRNQYPSVTAVVLNYNGCEDTIRCLSSLKEVKFPNLKIVIVDNGSVDESVQKFEKAFSSIPLLRRVVNAGYAAGNNAGIKYALDHNADYILIINNDATVEPDFLNHLVEYAEKNPKVGVLNARVFFPGANEIFSAAGRFNKFLCTGQNKGGMRVKKNETEIIKKVDYVCGVLMLIRSEVFRNVGLLDEKYFMYFEDLEFSRRVLKKYEMAYIPQSIAYHKSGGGKGWHSYTPLYLYYHTRNRILVFQEDMFLYRVYVWIFTLINSIAKSAVILLKLIDGPRRTKDQLKALWQGFIDGSLGKSGVASTKIF
jgi:GT2 family glycosyltransferase